MPAYAGQWPYPVNTDPVHDGAAAMEAIARKGWEVQQNAVNKPPYAISCQRKVITITGATSGYTDFTFPADTFPAAPLIMVTKVTGSGAATTLVPQVLSVSTTGCRIGLYSANNATVTVTCGIDLVAVCFGVAHATGSGSYGTLVTP
jgi:hypothetical protein